MAKSRDDMVTSAKALAGMENSNFVTDAQWAEWIERGVEDLWEKLLDSYGSDYFTKTASFSTVADTEDYDLATDFYQLVNLTADVNNKRRNLVKFEWADEASLRNINLLGNKYYYRIIGTTSQDGVHKIKLLPVPDSVFTVYYRYSYKPTFVAGAIEFDGINGWEEYAELVAAIKALNKEESDASALVGDLGRVLSRIEKHKASRDRSRPAKISDTRRDAWLRHRGRYLDDYA